MEKLLQLINKWEIQLLVLFSFMLQVFLFFTGGLRRRTTSKLLKFVIWIAYLGADLVAVYALGFLSRHEDATIQKDTLMGTHQLAFFWAPFLLIHLGGQDTITAFAIEDNNLWLRHLLNLVVQVTLALYIFWKSTSGPSMQLLVPSILLFVTGTIKYGERTWALWCGSLNSLASSTIPNYVSHLRGPIGTDACYSDIVSKALRSIQGVRDVFADSEMYYRTLDHRGEGQSVDADKVPKLLEVELGLMYDDIYTKAMVLRTRGGIILRCISQISFLVAFALFFASNKQRYNSVDNAITYALFIGGFSLEVCAIFITMRSPWIWAWLKDRKCHVLSSFVLSTCIGLQRKRPLWSNYMGQYNLLNFLGQNDQQSGLWKRRVMGVIRKVVNKVCGRKQKLWISKLLDTKFVVADEEIMRCVVHRVVHYRSDQAKMDQPWQAVGPLLEAILRRFDAEFIFVIFFFHVYTELLLSRYSPTGLDVESAGGGSVGVCRKMSAYMLYLLATHPEMLPVKKDSEYHLAFLLDNFRTMENLSNNGGMDDAVQRQVIEKLESQELPEPPAYCTEALLSEIQEAWMMLLLYTAGKSRPEVHAAQLARGGELLTFAWLLMAHHLLGNVGDRIELADIFRVEGAAIPSPLYDERL